MVLIADCSVKRFQRLILSLAVLTGSISCDAVHAASNADQTAEQNLLGQIKALDEQAKTESDIDQAIVAAKEAISMRRNLAGLYHKQAQYQKIPAIYDQILVRDEQLVHMGRMSNSEIASDYKYIADIYLFLGQDDLANRMKLKARAAQPPADPSGRTAVSSLNDVKKMRADGVAAMQKGDLIKAQLQLEKTLLFIDEKTEPELRQKMLAHTAGYSLDDWHACLLQEAQIYKDLADVWYKCGDLNKVKSYYEKLVVLKDSGGVSLADREKDYAYLVTLCDASKDVDKCVLYNILLLKARRSTSSEKDPAVLATFDSFAKFLRSVQQTERAEMLEARAKAIRSGSTPLPKLWFSF